jgi:hypothetical protein
MDLRRSAPEDSLRAHVKGVFSAFDTDGSGDISVSEFQDLLYTLGEVVDDDVRIFHPFARSKRASPKKAFFVL